MDGLLQRPALGQTVAIGTLYDSRTGEFLEETLLRTDLSETAVKIEQHNSINISYSHANTISRRFETLEVPHDLTASILISAASVKGVGRFLKDRLRAECERFALRHVLKTCSQSLNMQSQALPAALVSNKVGNNNATHMVVNIDWGCLSLISVDVDAFAAHTEVDTDGELRKAWGSFETSAADLIGPAPDAQRQILEFPMVFQAEITAYSEMFEHGDIMLSSLTEAHKWLKMIPLHASTTNCGKGWPLAYQLIPLPMLFMMLNVEIPRPLQCWLLTSDFVSSILSLLDDYDAVYRRFRHDEVVYRPYAAYLPADTQHNLRAASGRVDTIRRDFIEDVQDVYTDWLNGHACHDDFVNILRDYQQRGSSPDTIAAVRITDRELLHFIAQAESEGVTYCGYNGRTLDTVLESQIETTTYVLYYNSTSTEEHSWKANYDLFLELLLTQPKITRFAVVDCDAHNLPFQWTRVAQYNGHQEIVQDCVEYHSLAGKSFVSCTQSTLEAKNIQAPIKRRHVTIACPGERCSMAKVREWLCAQCVQPVEYGYSDQYIYCGCGRSLYSNYTFKCSSEVHGAEYVPYESSKLLNLLNGLSQDNYVNILILGESGVGKSTFINAVVNYLEFATLDGAIAADKLNYVIPCAFSTQVMDRDNPDHPIEEKHIKVGARDDEKDGSKGDSATQKTTVYPVTFNDGGSTLTVRLIDTPGIGDARGVEADRKNMTDILSTLSGYDTLHGILILLKSNNSRLNITFRYCMKELLTHLHAKAAANMVFGFTNTRISNYTPGDTFGPLKALLEQHQDIGIQLQIPTTYCFDSESFRYLAALKNGTTMPNKPDFDRSWEQSRRETKRLLDHFMSITPHEVKNTMSLLGARHLISELTKPLAHITQSINTTIQLAEDDMVVLGDSRVRGDALRDRLLMQRVQMNAVQLAKPRTVCAHASCTEVRDDGKGQNNKVIWYKQHCHAECYLNDVEADVMAHPGLMWCWAFNGKDTCHQCGHHWQQHLHVLYELYEETVTMADASIQQQIDNFEDNITSRQEAIDAKEALIAEFRQEQAIIRNAAAKFCAFLKQRSLAPYNDSLLAYLDHLIKEEQAKVSAGGNDKRLLFLTEERHKHQEATEVIVRHMNINASWGELDEGGVERLVQSLYQLPHFGQTLKDMKHGIAAAHEATYRERPHAIGRRHQPANALQTVLNRPIPYRSPSTSASKQRQTRSRGLRGMWSYMTNSGNWGRLRFR